MLILFALGSFLALKGYAQAKPGPSGVAAANAINAASIAAAASGSGPSNAMLADPSPDGTPAASQDVDSEFEDDGGPMGATLSAVGSASSDSDPGMFDQNVTQETSGINNAGSHLWKPPLAGRQWNRVLNEVWDDVLDVDYISAQPGIAFPFTAPHMTRQDNNPNFNRQPWARSQAFQQVDPTSEFETDGIDDPRVPAYDEDSEGDDE